MNVIAFIVLFMKWKIIIGPIQIYENFTPTWTKNLKNKSIKIFFWYLFWNQEINLLRYCSWSVFVLSLQSFLTFKNALHCHPAAHKVDPPTWFYRGGCLHLWILWKTFGFCHILPLLKAAFKKQRGRDYRGTQSFVCSDLAKAITIILLEKRCVGGWMA